MKKQSFSWLSALLVAGGLFSAGCSSSTSPTATPTPTQMQWKAGGIANYQSQAIDTTTNQPTGTPVNVTTTLVTSNVTRFGMTNVQVELNVYSDATPSDTGYYTQNSTGDLYARDFGSAGAINSLNQLLSVAGFSLPDTSWVLQCKMASAAGVSWIGFQNSITQSVTISGQSVPVTLSYTDNAMMMSDTTYTVSGKAYAVKHAQHVISASADGTILFQNINLVKWSEVIDTYVSADLAETVLNVTHPSAATVNQLVSAQTGFGNTKFDGTQNVLISHN
jgi:hypothetical protein